MRSGWNRSAMLLLAVGLVMAWPARRVSSADGPVTAAPGPDEAKALATEAYLFGFPLVVMDVTRQVHLAPDRDGKRKAVRNSFFHSRKFPDHTFTSVVSPNADTLYSNSWIDLTREPVILGVPDMGNRYYLMQFLDAWTNTFACPGTRTTGNAKQEFAIVGPDWKGELPTGVTVYRSPTNMVWLIGRTQTNGKEDYAAVHAIQDMYTLRPLSARGKDSVPPADSPADQDVDAKTPPAEQVRSMNAAVFFTRLNALMKNNPPAAADASVLRRLARIGIVPGQPFNIQAFDPAVLQGIEHGVTNARQRLALGADRPKPEPGTRWEINRHIGKYGTSYPLRALVALFALGANLPEDALYPRTLVDSEGQPLDGANRYVVRFRKDQLPPVNAFWSLTVYNSKQAFADNPIQRYAIGDRDHLKFADDGSLTLYIQHESPGSDKESNWLPTPKEGFRLFLRLYWPKKEALEGAWLPPAVERCR